MNARKSSSFIGVITVAVAGTVMSGAVALGHTWGDALISEVVTMLLALGYFVVTSSNSDVGAIYARRADERQHLVVLRASRFAMLAMFAVAFFGAAVTVALGEDYWQFDLVGSLGGVAYLLGLLSNGSHVEDVATERIDQ